MTLPAWMTQDGGAPGSAPQPPGPPGPPGIQQMSQHGGMQTVAQGPPLIPAGAPGIDVQVSCLHAGSTDTHVLRCMPSAC